MVIPVQGTAQPGPRQEARGSDFGNSHSIERAQDGLEAAAQFVTRIKAKYADAEVLVTSVTQAKSEL